MGKTGTMSRKGGVRLQVMIACYGRAGIERLMAAGHPRVAGVEYLVAWQQPDTDIPVPEELAVRDDFHIEIFKTRGLSRNRNHLLDMATAPLVLVSDDDLSYTEENLMTVMESFDEHPQCDVLTFRYDTDMGAKIYADHETPLDKIPKGSYVTSFEIAVRRNGLTAPVRFNEHFGVNCDFGSGEEDLYMHRLLATGVKSLFIPKSICFHPGLTTCDYADPGILTQNKGAVFLQLRGWRWPLYMLAHALREPAGRRIGYCRQWLRGVRKARQLKVFKN